MPAPLGEVAVCCSATAALGVVLSSCVGARPVLTSGRDYNTMIRNCSSCSVTRISRISGTIRAAFSVCDTGDLVSLLATLRFKLGGTAAGRRRGGGGAGGTVV